jgi:hypothetical protein
MWEILKIEEVSLALVNRRKLGFRSRGIAYPDQAPPLLDTLSTNNIMSNMSNFK